MRDETDWLSDDNDQRVSKWIADRNREYEKTVAPFPDVEKLSQRIDQLEKAAESEENHYFMEAGPRRFSLSSKAGYAGRVIVDQPSGRVVFDPADVKRKGSWSIDWFSPSPDGNLIAISASPDGTERGTLFLVKSTTGEISSETIYNVNNATAGGDVAWKQDGSGFYYTRYPQSEDLAIGASHQKLYFHQIGTDPKNDKLEFEPEIGKLAEIRIVSSPQTDRYIAWVQDGDSGTFSIYLRRNARWERLAGFEDGIIQPFFDARGKLYLISRAHSENGQVVSVDWNATNLEQATTFIPADDSAALASSFYSHSTPTAAWHQDRLFITYQMGGPMGLASFDQNGKRIAQTQFDGPSSVRSFYRDGDTVKALVESYLSPPQWISLSLDLKSQRATLDDSTLEIVRDFALSKDGVKIPFTILKTKGLAKPAPVLVYGYGGFGISRTPSYDASLRALLERGVAYVDTNIRGGSEFGESWRQAATQGKRQRAFDDFQAVIEKIHKADLSKPEWTAIEGSSNGGLLMGVTLTQRPELARTVLAHVGLYDMTRYEFGVNGAFNVAEYGDLDDAQARSALLRYSPLQNIRAGVDYPAVLFTVGANDPRVDPAHSRRMLDALSRADKDNDPLLIRTDFGAGHYGGSSEERRKRRAEEFAFLLDRFRHAGWKERN
jgi:prolyl oligopeptidase